MALQGRTVKDALRKGKNLWLELDEGPALMCALQQGPPCLQCLQAPCTHLNYPPGFAHLLTLTGSLLSLISMSWCRFHLGMTGSLAVKVCTTASFHFWQSLALPLCSVGKL